MPALTVKNVPEALAERLRESARSNRRSLNSEVLIRLETSFARPAPKGAEETIADLRRLHRRLSYLPPLTDEEIESGAESGRR